MKKKIITMLVLAMSMTSVMGVSAMASSTVATTNTEAATTKGERPERNGKMAKVTAVDGKKITVTIQAEPDETDTTEKTAPPEKPDTTDTTEKTAPPEKPDSTDSTDTSEGKRGGREMTFDGEEAVITITDDITVKTVEDGEMVELSYDDIEVDDVLMIEYADDGETITSISIRSDEMPQGGGNFKGEKPEKPTTDCATE
ncbi:MAG: hypothetical protein AB7E42_00265 [Anaerotignaceae bacterium]